MQQRSRRRESFFENLQPGLVMNDRDYDLSLVRLTRSRIWLGQRFDGSQTDCPECAPPLLLDWEKEERFCDLLEEARFEEKPSKSRLQLCLPGLFGVIETGSLTDAENSDL
jgi:hypothetical protein